MRQAGSLKLANRSQTLTFVFSGPFHIQWEPSRCWQAVKVMGFGEPFHKRQCYSRPGVTTSQRRVSQHPVGVIVLTYWVIVE